MATMCYPLNNKKECLCKRTNAMDDAMMNQCHGWHLCKTTKCNATIPAKPPNLKQNAYIRGIDHPFHAIPPPPYANSQVKINPMAVSEDGVVHVSIMDFHMPRRAISQQKLHPISIIKNATAATTLIGDTPGWKAEQPAASTLIGATPEATPEPQSNETQEKAPSTSQSCTLKSIESYVKKAEELEHNDKAEISLFGAEDTPLPFTGILVLDTDNTTLCDTNHFIYIRFTLHHGNILNMTTVYSVDESVDSYSWQGVLHGSSADIQDILANITYFRVLNYNEVCCGYEHLLITASYNSTRSELIGECSMDTYISSVNDAPSIQVDRTQTETLVLGIEMWTSQKTRAMDCFMSHYMLPMVAPIVISGPQRMQALARVTWRLLAPRHL
eukprot:486219_1